MAPTSTSPRRPAAPHRRRTPARTPSMTERQLQAYFLAREALRRAGANGPPTVDGPMPPPRPARSQGPAQRA